MVPRVQAAPPKRGSEKQYAPAVQLEVGSVGAWTIVDVVFRVLGDPPQLALLPAVCQSHLAFPSVQVAVKIATSAEDAHLLLHIHPD